MTTRPGYVWDATALEWVEIGQAAVLAPVKYQASAPSSPATGDIWIESDVDVPSIDSAQFLRWRKTMTGGETSLSGNDDSSLPLAYTPGYEQLYINGVLQVRGQDYTATTGTTVTGLTALVANDVVEIFSAVARTVADVYTQTQSDARFVNKTAPGSVVQVLNVTKTDAQTISGALWNDISGLSLSITPRYATSKILIIADVKAAANSDASTVRSRVLRDSTAVGVGDAASNRPRSLSEFYLTSGGGEFYVAQLGGNIWDSPNTTSTITYKVQLGGDSNGSTVFINRTEGDRDSAYYDGRFISSITLMEIAQ
jgi:hypothetical protein